MSARLLLLICSVALIAGPSNVRAQERSFKWWQAESTRTELKITPAQSAKLEEVFQSLVGRLRAAKDDLAKQETELSKRLDAMVPEAQVIQQVGQVEAARAELSKTRTLMLYRMNLLLSPEQRAKLKELHERWDAQQKARPTIGKTSGHESH